MFYFRIAPRKNTFYFLLFMITGLCYGQQRPVFFGGFDYYRDKSFDVNAFGNLNLGVQVYEWKFFAPEFGFNYYFGGLIERVLIHLEESQVVVSYKSDAGFGSAVFLLSSSMIVGNMEAALILMSHSHA